MNVGYRCAVCLLLALGGDGSAQNRALSGVNGSVESIALGSRGDRGEGTLFESLSADRTGIDFVHRWSLPQEGAVDLELLMIWGGVCIGDVDTDGLPDVYLTRPRGGCRLYRNLGDWRFEDVTDRAGLRDEGLWGTGAGFVDIDNDGDLDLYVCAYDSVNRLYINEGNGSFTERAEAYGLDFAGASVMMAFADYDLDGDLDGYLLTNHLERSKQGAQLDYRRGRWEVPDSMRERARVIYRPDGSYFTTDAGQADHLFRNNGDGTFTDVSDTAGIRGYDHGLSATWWDYDADGYPDLYVANDFYGADQLLRNNGDGTFTDVVATALPHVPWFSMGSDAADINNDGLIDFMGSDMSGTTHFKQKLGMGNMVENWFLASSDPRQTMRNAVYLNTGTGRFMEVAYLLGLADTDWTWSIKFADLDNDGWEDLFVSNGMTRDWADSDLDIQVAGLGGQDRAAGRRFWLEQPKRAEANLAFRNRGGLRFENVGERWGLDHVGVSFGAALGDLDRDGDLDLIVNNFEAAAGVYRNRSTEGRRVLVRLEGRASNRHGIGATVRIETDGGGQMRYLSPERGFMGANEPVVHFGLGDHERIERLTVEWPGGSSQRFEDLAADRLYTIREPKEARPEIDRTAPPPIMFARSDALQWIDHIEQPYDDYRRQPLLPQRLSQAGPGMAWGDVDGDGDEDLYVGGAAGQAGMLYVNEGGGLFRWGPLGPFNADAAHEDMAPLFFDADGDDDADLFVVSGGVECDPGDEALRDRLYLNDGTGRFTPAPAGSLPDLRDSGSAAAAADFDRDGDLDLFVGGRSIPGKYPLTPNSRLLRNDRGTFSDVTDQIAPGLRQSGMVTGALWSDADADGWLDLLVTHEWGPVKLYRNERGRLVDRTLEAGLARWVGWWNGIAARDIDGDADIDYVATNFGLNTKYHPTPERPALLYYGDFEGTGEMRLVEADYEDETLYPVRGRSCSTHAMPSLGERFPTFRQFALASVEEIYTPQCLSDAFKLEATTLESAALINDGAGKFTRRALDRLAQASPGFGVVLTEVDGDGRPDLYIVQNFFSPQPETGRMDGGVSLLLTGDGDGGFSPVRPDRSGLVVPGDAKGLGAVDLNGDGWKDFVVGVNDGRLLAFENQGDPVNRVFNLSLQGPRGNPTGVGSRVTVYLRDGSVQSAERYAGSSYLSQSSNALTFGMGPAGKVEKIQVRWPDGRRQEITPSGDPSKMTVVHPDRSSALENINVANAALTERQPKTHADQERETPSDYAKAHVELGSALESRGRLDAAIRHYRRALDFSPASAEIHNHLGRTLAAQEKWNEAIKELSKALEINPRFAEARVNLGIAYESRNETDQAIKEYRKALGHAPDNSRAHHRLGLALESRGKFEAAFEHFGRALELNPDYVGVHRDLGMVRSSQQRPEQAIDHFRLVLRIVPDDADANYQIGIALRVQDRADEAIKHYRRAIDAQPDHADAHYELAFVLGSKGELDGAIDHYRRVIEARPAYAQAHNNLGAMLGMQGQLDEAISHYRQALAVEPDYVDAHQNLGQLLFRTKRAEEALGHFRLVLDAQPDRLAVLADAAWILATHSDADVRAPREAVQYAERASRLTRNRHPAVLDILAAAYAADGQFDRAAQTAQAALDLAPSAPQSQTLTDPIRERLELYRQSKPFHQPTPPPNEPAPAD